MCMYRKKYLYGTYVGSQAHFGSFGMCHLWIGGGWIWHLLSIFLYSPGIVSPPEFRVLGCHESYMEMKWQEMADPCDTDVSFCSHTVSMAPYDSTRKTFQRCNSEAFQEGDSGALNQVQVPLRVVLCIPIYFAYSKSWPEAIATCIGRHCPNTVYGLCFCNIEQ